MSQSCYQMWPNVTKSSNQHSCEGLRYLVWGHNPNWETLCISEIQSLHRKVKYIHSKGVNRRGGEPHIPGENRLWTPTNISIKAQLCCFNIFKSHSDNSVLQAVLIWANERSRSEMKCSLVGSRVFVRCLLAVPQLYFWCTPPPSWSWENVMFQLSPPKLILYCFFLPQMWVFRQ